MKIQSILFVCMGNICRSPSAENVMRKLLQDAGLEDKVQVDSAGTIGMHTGNPPDSRMTVAGKKRGYPMTGSARKIQESDLVQFDLIVGMDDDNIADIRALDTSKDNYDKISSFCDFCTTHSDKTVPDPYYGGTQGFEHVMDLLEDGCQQILEFAKRTLR